MLLYARLASKNFVLAQIVQSMVTRSSVITYKGVSMLAYASIN